jgi:putative phage-type endonuclease
MMAITEKQRELRKKHLGGSDMPAILGMDPWKNVHDVWLDKTGRLADLEPTAPMKLGTFLEGGILQLAEEVVGKILPNQYRSAEGLPIGSNLDGIVIDEQNPIEVKTAGIARGFAPKEEWGDENTDQVPAYCLIQCQTQLLCTKADLCHVAALLGGRGFKMYQIMPSKEIMDVIVDQAQRFWNNYIVKDTPPPNISPSFNVVKRMIRQPGKVIDMEPEVVEAWQQCKELEKAVIKDRKAAEAELLANLDDAEAANIVGMGQITYMEQSRKGYEVKPTTFRVLRFKAKKKDCAILRYYESKS